MAGLFGSGPQSNILNTVQGSYTAMLNAEKQKGQAAHQAMGAFGKAISPKAIGMTNFKNDFKDADWSKPETYARAGQQLMPFDPAAGLSMMDKGRSLAASMAPKAPVWKEVTTVKADGSSSTKFIDLNEYKGEVSTSAAPSSDAGSVLTGKEMNAKYGTSYPEDSLWNVSKDNKISPVSTGDGVNVEVNINDQGKQDLTKTVRNELQKQLVNAQKQKKSLSRMSDSIQDKFLTISGQTKAAIGGTLDRLNVSEDTPLIGGLVTDAAEARVFHNEVAQLFNAYRKEITGAAAAVAELERLEQAYLSDKNMGPATFKTVLKNMEKVYQEGVDELKTQLTEGLDINTSLQSKFEGVDLTNPEAVNKIWGTLSEAEKLEMINLKKEGKL